MIRAYYDKIKNRINEFDLKKEINKAIQKIKDMTTMERLYLLFECALVLLFFHDALFPSQLTLVSLCAVVVFGGIIIIKTKKFYYNPFLISFCIFTLIATVATLILKLGENDPIRRLGLIGMQLLAGTCIFNYLMNTKNFKRFMKIFAIVAIISLILIFIILGNKAFSTRLGHNGASKTISYYLLWTPIYKSSNGTANICAIAVLFLLFFGNKAKGKKEKRLYYIFAGILILGVLICGSRKGLLTLIVYVLYSFTQVNIDKKKKRIIYILVPITILILIFSVPFLYKSIGKRVQSTFLNIIGITNRLDQNSLNKRNELQDEALRWIKDNPIIGYGFNTFSNTVGNGSESNILQITLDLGIISLIVYYSFLPALFKSFKNSNKNSELIKLFTVLIICILIQDFGTVSYGWLFLTMWNSVYWAVYYTENNEEKYLEIDDLKKYRGIKDER